MPTYEYQCDKCGRVFEVRQRISEPALTACDVCGGEVRRLLSAAPFILKGEGWYVTDYPSEARKKARESEKSTAADSSKADTGKADTGKKDAKPATTSASESSASPPSTSSPSPPSSSSSSG